MTEGKGCVPGGVGGLTASRSGATGGQEVTAFGSAPAGKQVTQQQRSSRGDNRESENICDVKSGSSNVLMLKEKA